jgi:hypothetical protein
MKLLKLKNTKLIIGEEILQNLYLLQEKNQVHLERKLKVLGLKLR